MAKKDKTKEVILPQRYFKCDTCKGLPHMEFKDFEKHLHSEHNLASSEVKGSRQMIMHIDFDDHYISQYKWTLESGLIFYQEVITPRKTPMF